MSTSTFRVSKVRVFLKNVSLKKVSAGGLSTSARVITRLS
jgi:hypothetical protein